MPRVDAMTGRGGEARDPRGPAPATGAQPSDVPPAADPEASSRPTRSHRLRKALGTAPSRLSPPLSKYRWLRWLTYLLVGWLALGIFLGGGSDMSNDYGLSTPQGLLAGFVQGVAVVLALRRPGRAWALSLSGAVVTALIVRARLPDAQPGPDWPWSAPEILAHAAVFLFVALRLPTRTAIAALMATGLATFVVQGIIGGGQYESTGVTAVAIFAVAVLIGTAFRGRAEARTRLVQQETITAEERSRRTLLEERSRIARELHDVVAHHMSVISIQAQVAPHLVENPSEELKENLDGIRKNALEALTELRRVLGVLRSEHPEDPDDPYGLGEAGTGTAPDAPQPTLDRLDALIDNTRAAGLDVVTEIRGEPSRPYSPGVELSAYRIVQEGLSNALRHAPGSTVRVEITHFPEGLYLSVINSRPEHPVQPSPGAGHGLLGMRERATMLGGHLTATRTLHGGFAVSAFLPRDGRPHPDGPRRPTTDPRLPAPELHFPPPDAPDHVTLQPPNPAGEESP
ncbi:two-component sensor histidine kinase [Streptomyces spinoverrucosus]|uniref:histidine kinase n=2 Tax=Streptomyces spinoverrucosus TaxID=284043 RepID=A0A4Y3VGS4_9ACTN|nr:two-component sensor histidine kinase [Streptomyces spinoverrucosus]GHB75956.1 two-component sensor histidine kinase [Streptomyces spinoverrucosus]